MDLGPELVAIVACPKSKQAMIYFSEDGFFLCPTCRLRYDVDDGVPNFVVEEATQLSAGEVDRLLARARELDLRVP